MHTHELIKLNAGANLIIWSTRVGRERMIIIQHTHTHTHTAVEASLRGPVTCRVIPFNYKPYKANLLKALGLHWKLIDRVCLFGPLSIN